MVNSVKSKKNNEKISNLITYALTLKNLGSHYKFVKENNHHKILIKKNGETPYIYFKNLVLSHPKIQNENALVQDKAITFMEMLTEVDKLADYIYKNIEYNKGDKASICSDSSSEGIISFFSMNKLGLANSRIFNGSKEEKMEFNINNFNSKLMFTDSNNIEIVSRVIDNTKVKDIILMDKCDKSIIEKIQNKGVKVHEWDDIQKSDIGNLSYEPCKDPDALASILYTSGSSGEPKPISISNKVYTNMVKIVSKTTNVKSCESEKVVSVVSHEYPYAAINSTIMILLMGKTLILQSKDEKIMDMLDENQVDRIQAIPNFYKIIEDTKDVGKLSYLKYVISGGEHYLTEEKKKLLNFLNEHDADPLLIDGFGFGELGSATALKFGLNDYFMLMNGIEAKAIDPKTHADLGNDKEGILCLSGPTIADGYYNNEEATNKSFVTDENGKKWFISDTYGSVHGKFKRLIKLGGRIREYFITDDGKGNFVKIYAGNVEEVISSVDYIEDCIIVPSDASATPRSVAYISLMSDCNLSREKIIDLVNEKCNSIEEFAKPIEINIEDEIQRTSAGKKNYAYYRKKRLI